MREIQDNGLTARMLGWLRRTVVNLSERSVDEAIDNTQDSAIDFEILNDPSHPRYPEMRRRYHELEAREDPSDRD
jgi:archaellum component FlaG (FlaF/FlaG flagellin family)